jgi:integrase
MKLTTSPYLKGGRLADVIAAIQIMGVYPWASRQVEDWARKIGDPLSGNDWSTVFREHTEFFRLTNDGWASLRWRHGYDRTYDANLGRELGPDEYAVRTDIQKRELTRKPLTADQIEALLKTAVEFHSRAIADQQERRWLVPLLFGIVTALLAFLGSIIGAILKSGASS